MSTSPTEPTDTSTSVFTPEQAARATALATAGTALADKRSVDADEVIQVAAWVLSGTHDALPTPTTQLDGGGVS